MLLKISSCLMALSGFFSREAAREEALPWHQLALRVGWLAGQWQQHAPITAKSSRGFGCRLTDDYFRVLSRKTLPYLSAAFSWETWRELHADHCAYLAEYFGSELYERISLAGVPLWLGDDRASGVTVSLEGPCPHREGGLTVVMRLDGDAVYRIAFSFVQSQRINPAISTAAMGIYVGQVQGYPGCFEQIKEATRRCRDVAPPDVLVAALVGVAGALGITLIQSVSLEDCPSYRNIASLGNRFNLAQFWVERYGARPEGRHYQLSLPLQEKPISEVKANHRGRTLAKRQLKHAVAAVTGAQLQSCLPVRAPTVAPHLARRRWRLA